MLASMVMGRKVCFSLEYRLTVNTMDILLRMKIHDGYLQASSKMVQQLLTWDVPIDNFTFHDANMYKS